MVNKRTRQRKKYQNQKNLTLNAAIGIVGVFLLAFIYSFSKNSSHNGISMEKIIFPDHDKPRKLAANIYEKQPIHQVKVEILNGCGIQGLAAKTAEFLLLEHQIDVVKSDNADNHEYPKTLIIGRNEKLQSIELLSKSFGVSIDNKSVIQHQPDESLGVDVTVILGKDINTYTKVFDYISNKK